MSARLSPLHWLLIILVVTALQWWGSAYIGLSTDDYHYLQHLAPLDGISDIPGAFLKSDANPQYWRPISNATLTADFLLYGFNGGGYHMTNLLLHLIATGLVFYTCRRSFALDSASAILASLLFGICAGHDSNLLWIAARGDILATIFSLSTLLLLDSERSALRWCALLTYFLALCSKELSIMAIPVAVLFQLFKAGGSWSLKWNAKWKPAAITLLSLLAVTAIYVVLRSNFTLPATEAQPMLGEGMRSPLTAIKNVVYGVAYLVLPLDLSTASTILTTYKLEALIIGILLVGILAVVLKQTLQAFPWRSLILPLIFSAFFVVTVAQSFERWRLYAPSVGLFAIISVIAVHVWRHNKALTRSLLVLTLLVFASFHAYRASVEKRSWRLASELLQEVKHDLKGLIAHYGEQPLFLVTQPSKIGGGSVMKVSSSRLVLQAKAELLKPQAIRYADVRGLAVDHRYGVLVLALDPAEGFSPISVARTAANTYRISVPPGSATRIQPELIVTGSTDRERSLHSGDTLYTIGGKVIIHQADRNYATDVTLITEASDRVPVFFDGSGIVALP